jgi:hypothetical protein
MMPKKKEVEVLDKDVPVNLDVKLSLFHDDKMCEVIKYLIANVIPLCIIELREAVPSECP